MYMKCDVTLAANPFWGAKEEKTELWPEIIPKNKQQQQQQRNIIYVEQAVKKTHGNIVYVLYDVNYVKIIHQIKTSFVV